MYEEKGFKALRLNEFAQFESLKIKISSQFFLFFIFLFYELGLLIGHSLISVSLHVNLVALMDALWCTMSRKI